MPAREPLIFVAAGGLAREAAEAARAGDRWDPVGYVDDDPASHGTTRTGLPVLGPLDLLAGSEARVVLCAGSGAARLRIAGRLAETGLAAERYATVRHPSVHVPGSCSVGTGSILLAGVVLTADVHLGEHVVAMPNAVLTHDDDVADAVTLCAAVALAGRVRVGTGAYLGAGAVVRENLRVGAGAVLGQGTVVLNDVPDDEVWVGNPARLLRSALRQQAIS